MYSYVCMYACGRVCAHTVTDNSMHIWESSTNRALAVALLLHQQQQQMTTVTFSGAKAIKRVNRFHATITTTDNQLLRFTSIIWQLMTTMIERWTAASILLITSANPWIMRRRISIADFARKGSEKFAISSLKSLCDKANMFL